MRLLHWIAAAAVDDTASDLQTEIFGSFEPRNLGWTGVPARDTVPCGDISVRFCGFLARRDDDADCTLLGEATLPESHKSVQSRP